MIGLAREDYPKIVIVHPHKLGIDKYIFREIDLKQNLTYDKLMSFLGHFKAGLLNKDMLVEDNHEMIDKQRGEVWKIKGNKKLLEFLGQ